MSTHAVKYKVSDNQYVFGGSNDIGLCNLGNFLTADLGKSYWASFRTWATDELQSSASTNVSHLLKSKSHILIGNLYATESHDTYFSLPLAQFVNLLDQWQLIQTMSIEELYIIAKDGTLKIFVIDTAEQHHTIIV